MLTQTEILNLSTRRFQHPVLSVYWNTDPSQGTLNTALHRLRLLLKPYEEEAPEDVQAILHYAEYEYGGEGKTLALFSCAGEDYFLALPAAFPVSERVRRSPLPHIKPLANQMNIYANAAIALVDKQTLRLFRLNMGTLEEVGDYMGEEVRQVKRGGASSFPGRRGGTAGRTDRMPELIERNMRQTAAFAANLFDEHKIRHVLLAGSDDNVAQLHGHLPQRWQNAIAGKFTCSITAPPAEILEQALKILEAVDAEAETGLVERVLTAAAKSRDGAAGLQASLDALHDGRVMTLLVHDGYRAPGERCANCDALLARHVHKCPFCGGKTEKITDVVNLAVIETLRGGGEVEMVADNAGLRNAGSVAALLRY